MGGLDGVVPGSSCIANAYSNNHDELAKEDIGWGTWAFLHMVDAVALVHALILRLQALVFPIQRACVVGPLTTACAPVTLFCPERPNSAADTSQERPMSMLKLLLAS